MRNKKFDSNVFNVENFESFMVSFYDPAVSPSSVITDCPVAQFVRHITEVKKPIVSYVSVFDKEHQLEYALPEWACAVSEYFTFKLRTASVGDIIAKAREFDPVEVVV